MKSILQRVLFFVIALAIAGGLIWGFLAGRTEQAAEAQREAPVEAKSRVLTENGRTVLQFDSQAQQANGIVTTVLNATKQQPENQATGVVVQLQPLLDLKASYNTPAMDLIKARASARASAAEYERLRLLNEAHKDASDKAVEAARATAESDAAVVQNAQQTITVLKGSAVLHWGPVVASWIEGSSRQLDDLLMQRAFLLQVTSTMDGSFSAPKQAIVQYGDGTRAQVQFISVLPQLDPRLQTPSLLYLLATHPGLVPGINLSVFLPWGRLVSGVSIPSSAIVWSHGSAWCYVEESPGKFVRLAVHAANPNTHGWFVTEGIRPGARVVTSGAQTLLSEEFRSQIQTDQD